MQIGGNVAGLIEHGVARFDRNLFDEFADAELLLANDFDAHDIFIRIEGKHYKAFFRAEGFRCDHFCVAEPDVGCGGFRVDLDNWRFGDRNHEAFKRALPSIR